MMNTVDGLGVNSAVAEFILSGEVGVTGRWLWCGVLSGVGVEPGA